METFYEDIRKIARELVEIDAELASHDCGARWCPGYDSGCRRSSELMSKQWELKNKLLRAMLGDDEVAEAERCGKDEALRRTAENANEVPQYRDSKL